jgi:hypothetical protein
MVVVLVVGKAMELKYIVIVYAIIIKKIMLKVTGLERLQSLSAKDPIQTNKEAIIRSDIR